MFCGIDNIFRRRRKGNIVLLTRRRRRRSQWRNIVLLMTRLSFSLGNSGEKGREGF